MGCVIVDTEYTTWPGALQSGWAEPWQHREIVQIAAIRADDDWNETASLDLLVRPRRNPELSPLFVELTRITRADVDSNGLDFAEAVARFAAFSGTDAIVCMNADEAVFRENCGLCALHFPFGRSFHRLWPFLDSLGVNPALSSGDLHTLTANPLHGHVHNALHDVRSMGCWLKDARARGIISDISELPTGAPTRDRRSRPTG